MRKLIVLNEYDESALADLLESVIDREYKNFEKMLEDSGIEYETHSNKEDADFLRYKCTSKMKEHIYFKAVTLRAELFAAREDQT